MVVRYDEMGGFEEEEMCIEIVEVDMDIVEVVVLKLLKMVVVAVAVVGNVDVIAVMLFSVKFE